MTLRSLLAISPFLLTLACVHDVSKGKTVATVEPASSSPAEQLDAPVTRIRGAQLVPADPTRSKVHALGAKVTATHPIAFSDWTGAMQVKGGDLVGVDVTVQVMSLSTDIERLTSHLLNEDFLFAEAFPTAHFRSTSIEPSAGADGATHLVTGELSLRGHTNTLSFPATLASTDSETRADAELVIDRRDFDIVYPGRADDMIQTSVVLTIQLVGDAA